MIFDERADQALQLIIQSVPSNGVHLEGNVVPIRPGDPRQPTHDEETMATSDKDYIDARLETISTKMAGDVKAIVAEMAGSVKVIETQMDGRLASIESKMDAKFAELRSDMHKGTSELVKWVVGTAFAMVAVAMTVMTFVLNNAVPKATSATPPAPIIIYAQPAPAAPPSVAPPAKP